MAPALLLAGKTTCAGIFVSRRRPGNSRAILKQVQEDRSVRKREVAPSPRCQALGPTATLEQRFWETSSPLGWTCPLSAGQIDLRWQQDVSGNDGLFAIFQRNSGKQTALTM